jgi:membrane protease YdiL (CAAX protease family)
MKNRPTFWHTLRLLLGAARKRSTGRQTRQQELLSNRSGKNATDWGGFGFVMAALFMVGINVAAAFVLRTAIATAQRVEAERRGDIVVSRQFLHEMRFYKHHPELGRPDPYQPDNPYSTEAHRIATEYGGSEPAIEQRLRDGENAHGPQAFLGEPQAITGLSGLATSGPFAPMIGSLVFLWWLAMLVFQCEGLELDLQRRRHPMWEWLFSHPAQPGAIFLAEMLSPIAANPIYWGAPLFVATIYTFVYNFGIGLLAGILIGIPITIAAACLGKACEIAVTLRFSPRSRGAMIGFMSWIGYASLMLFFLGIFLVPRIIVAAARILYPLTILPWPWLRLFLGGQSNGTWFFPSGLLACWIFAAIIIAGSVRFSVWGAQLGLSGVSGDRLRPPTHRTRTANFGKDPLYRKEFLWFVRDRSAIVQTILIPLTIASVQVFNLRGILVHAQGAWNYLCGTGILFGTYFLWILGPKSLSSEGSALWIALTWPRGLESLLKAKAWLWSLISSSIVALVLAYAAFTFHADAWKIALVLIGWFFFSRSMAEKSVTLVTITSESGEVQKIPWGRRLAAQLGMLTFSIGIISQQWHIAVMGIVYSYMTAAAMWQNFRARLPYLYDPWSEELPPPPTLMHAMISISILVECGAIVTGILLVFAGPQNIAIAQAIAYAVCSVAVSVGVISFLGERNVSLQDVIRWRSAASSTSVPQLIPALMLAAAGGIALGLAAHGYLAALEHIPATAELIRKSQEAMAKLHDLRISYAIMAVVFAPFAEEYLFRGLLFRALDREWGGWRAIIGSAAFFAVYHPAMSWPPVFLLGVCNALIFKKSGRLAPAILLHMVYNAVVLM